MSRHLILISLLGVIAGGTATAGVYKCVVDGKPVFSQIPCAPDAEVVNLDIVKPTAEQQDASAERLANVRATQSDAKRERDRELALRQAEREVRRLEAARDRELAEIERKRGHAANNMAGAVWEQSLATDKQTVVAKYSPRIEAAQQEVRRLSEQRD